MSQFVAQILAQLDTQQAEAKLKALTKNRDIDLKVNLTGDTELKEIKSILNSLSKQKIKLNYDNSEINKTKSDFQILKNLANEISQKKIRLATLDSSKNVNQISELTKQIKDLQSSYDILKSQFGTSLNIKQIGQLEQIFGKTNDKVSELAARTKDLKSVETAISKVEVASSKLSTFKELDSSRFVNATSYNEMITYISNAESAMSRFNKEKSKGEQADFSILTKEMNNVTSATKKAETQYDRLMKSVNRLDAETASNKVLSWLENNNKVYKDKSLSNSIQSIANDLANVTYQGEYDSLMKELENYKSIAQSRGLTGRSWFSDFKQATTHIAQFAGIYGVLQNIVMDVPRQMVQAVKDVDSAMTNLYKVTDATTQKYDEFLSKTGETAKSLGRDISSYIEQTSEWAKLGYDIDQSANLAKVSSMYANVAEVDDKTAVSDLVTVLKAYNMQDTQAIQIGDMLNELGNRYATSAADLGTGLSKMASTMSMSGISLEKALAILTGGVEITQDADALGNAIKVSVLRMRGQKGALEEIGEYADDVESVSKMQTQILNMTKGAVNIMDAADPTSFRDYYDVMKDISEILPTLSETDQANLIETLFGKNRANQGQAILQAFQSGQIQKAYETAMNSQGSMQEEQDRWLQSAEADFCLVA